MAHSHPPETEDYSRSFAVALVLNIAFVAIEAGYGVMADSLALVADAGHNLSDVGSILLAWGASALSRKAATQKRTYGFRKATVLASLASAILLLVALGGIAWEAVGRFAVPRPVEGGTVVVVAGIGVAVNALTALLFLKGRHRDLNIRGAFLHMAADAGVSLGVVFAGIFMLAGGGAWIDPVASLVVVVVVFFATWGLLKDSLDHIIDAVPDKVDYVGIRQYLVGLERVVRIHDLHIWPLSTTEVALTVHLVVREDRQDNDFLLKLQQHLHDHFGIEHATIQVEAWRDENECMLDRDNCG